MLGRLVNWWRQRNSAQPKVDDFGIPPVQIPAPATLPPRVEPPEAPEFQPHEPGACDFTDPARYIAIAWNSSTGELQMGCRQCHTGDVYDVTRGFKCTRHEHLEMLETDWDEERGILHHVCLLCNPDEFLECPCCRHRTLPRRDLWEVCPVCNWEDDPFMTHDESEEIVEFKPASVDVGYEIDPTLHAAGSGIITLAAARRNYQKFGACNMSGRNWVVSFTQFQKSIETDLYGQKHWQEIARNRWPEEQQVVIASQTGEPTSVEPAPQPAVDEDGWPTDWSAENW